MASAAALLPALSNGDVIMLVVLLAIPVAAIAFAVGAGNRFDEIGKGGFGLELEQRRPAEDARLRREAGSDAVSDAEVRQMLEAQGLPAACPRRGAHSTSMPSSSACSPSSRRRSPDLGDAGLREEVRQLVIARNERRQRQGKEPLDVEAEVGAAAARAREPRRR